MAQTEQRTLTGREARCGRYRPQTLVYCHDCREYILRSALGEHGIPPRPRWDNQFVEPRPENVDGRTDE